MSTSDQQPENSSDGSQLSSAGRELVHNVATPLATLQLNLQVLATYLPALMSHYRDTPGVPVAIKPDHLAALSSLPEALDADIRNIRHAVKLFSSILVPVTAAPSPESGGTATKGDTLIRVLLVEDETIHQEITRKQCANLFHLDVAATAKEALVLASEARYDLVLVDLMLSGNDSRSLVGDLRAVSGADMLIIAVSNMPLALDEVRTLGLDGALGKPFKASGLQALLQQLRKTQSA